jgi:hypothetical protein
MATNMILFGRKRADLIDHGWRGIKLLNKQWLPRNLAPLAGQRTIASAMPETGSNPCIGGFAVIQFLAPWPEWGKGPTPSTIREQG